MSIVADAGNTVMVSSDMTDAIEDMEGKVVYMQLKRIAFHLNPLRNSRKPYRYIFSGQSSKTIDVLI